VAEGDGGSDNLVGPERPTLAERFILLFHLPYLLGCFLVGFILWGILDVVLDLYLRTLNLGQAVAQAFAPITFLGGALFVYVYYAPHWMRRRVLETEPHLSALLPGGKGEFRNLFRGIGGRRQQVAAWVIFYVLILVFFSILPPFLAGPVGQPVAMPEDPLVELLAQIRGLVFVGVVALALSSLVWVYLGTLRGIARIEAATLKLRSCYEDRMLGLRPMGSLALSMAAAYFGFLAFFLLVLAVWLDPSSRAAALGFGFVGGLILLGVLMFFWPLVKLHRRMLQQKTTEHEQLGRIFDQMVSNPNELDSIGDLARLFRTDVMRREVARVATWPFDTGILGRLSIIVLSVTAAVITQYIVLFLGL